MNQSDVSPQSVKELHESMQKAFSAMQDNIKRAQDTAEKAREEVRQEGTLHGKTADQLKELGEQGRQFAEDFKGFRDRLTDIEQKAAQRPNLPEQVKSVGRLVVESDSFKAAGKLGRLDAVEVPSFSKVAITEAANSTTGTLNPLVAADRVAGIVNPAQRRLLVRGLIPQRMTSSNMVEVVKENVFTNNAGPQYDSGSPTPGQETAEKNESGITFSLSQIAVTTLAHWIPASRQALADSDFLAGFIDGRLRYGLAFEEEDELLNSTGTNGELNGLLNQATAFAGGATNQTAIDTLLKAFTQVTLAEYEASAVVLHPTDWQNIMLLKDTQGRYLFADPQAMAAPRIWGRPVVPTQSMTQGQFLTGAFDLACEIFDREIMTVRTADQHDKFFIKNMVAILAEERLALVVYRSAALVKGSLSYAG